MKDQLTPAGTTLEILQAYPLGTLRVRTPDGDGTVIGFMYNKVSERYCPVVDLDISRDKIGMGYSVVDCLPYLNGFSALTEPLEDGTISAVEVAKLVMQASRPEGRTPIAGYSLPKMNSMGTVVSVDCHRDTSYTLELLIDASGAVCTVYDFGIVYAGNMLTLHDYLRSKGFALPVNGRPLVEGVDFIPKASASVPMSGSAVCGR